MPAKCWKSDSDRITDRPSPFSLEITLAGTMLRAPMSLKKMRYDAETGTVLYRSKMHFGPARQGRGTRR